jgi:hypothetical protein
MILVLALAEIWREHRIREALYYKWGEKFLSQGGGISMAQLIILSIGSHPIATLLYEGYGNLWYQVGSYQL